MLVRSFLFIQFLLLIDTISPASQQEYWNEKRLQAMEWVEAHYQQALQVLLPVGLAAADRLCSDKPECPEWVVTTRTLLPWNDLEFQFTIEKAFNGTIMVIVLDPIKSSIFN